MKRHISTTNSATAAPSLYIVAFSIVLMAAVALFYALAYPYHLHYYEQMQLFEFTWPYFWQTVLLPGGMADWLGRCLTQFYHITWAGALIMALLYGSVYLTSCHAVTKGLTGRTQLLWAALMLLPMRYLWVHGCDENAMPALWIALASSLLCTACLRNIGRTEGWTAPRHTWLRRCLTLLLTVVLYALTGPLAALMAALMLVHELRQHDAMRWLYALILAITAACLPLVAYHCCDWPLSNLYRGLHYFRFIQVQLPHPWIVAGLIVLLDIVAPLLQRRVNGLLSIPSWMLTGGMALLMAVFIASGVRNAYRPNNEVLMMYDDMVLNERWDDIVEQGLQRTPKHTACLQCINLALAMTGQMGDKMFYFPQGDIKALMPQMDMNFSRPLTAGIIYYNIGWTNIAQRFVFEANESIPDYEKSARCYKMLAKTHIVRGEKALARKYLTALTHTLFYRDWAEETLRLIDNPDPKALAKDPEYGQMMKCGVRNDYFFSPDVLAMLGDYCTTTPHNRVATQYLLAVALVQRNLKTFSACYRLGRNLGTMHENIPRYWQEALALDWWNEHHTMEGLPYEVEPDMLAAFGNFMSAASDKEHAHSLSAEYIFTYWYYYVQEQASQQ